MARGTKADDERRRAPGSERTTPPITVGAYEAASRALDTRAFAWGTAAVLWLAFVYLVGAGRVSFRENVGLLYVVVWHLAIGYLVARGATRPEARRDQPFGIAPTTMLAFTLSLGAGYLAAFAVARALGREGL